MTVQDLQGVPPSLNRQGRYHALTLQIAEDGTTWQVTADQPFETRQEARSWAERLAAETPG